MLSGKPAAKGPGTFLGSFRSILVQGSSAGVEARPGRSSGLRVSVAGWTTPRAHSAVLGVSRPEAKQALGFLGLSKDLAGSGGPGPGLSASEEASISLGTLDSPLPLTSSPKKQPALETGGADP